MLKRVSHRPVVQRWLSLISEPEKSRISMGELTAVYSLWVVAFMLKLIGSSWDVAWHFRFLRDDFAPPHIINTLGTILAFSLLLIQSYKGMGTDQRGLRIAQVGVGVFLLAIPLDLLNHRIFGLDLTTWSMTHSLLYLGTGLLLIGVLWSWLMRAQAGRTRTLFALAFGAFLLEDVLFPLGQQEFGVLAIEAFLRGRPTADAALLALAGGNLVTLIQGSLPAWLYPFWLILGSSVVLVAMARLIPFRWTATIISTMYLVYRYIAHTALTTGGFPPSFIPFMLLGAALVIDLAAAFRWANVVTILGVVGSFYLGAALVDLVVLMPPFPWSVAPIIVLLLWATLRFSHWKIVQRLARSWIPASAGKSIAQ